MSLWNMKYLYSPPINSVKMQGENLDTIHLKAILDDATMILKEKYMLHREAAVLSRYLYKQKRRFSGHKSLSYMAKVCRGLKRYLSLDLLQVYSNFAMLLSHVDGTDEWVYVPTRQILEYLLVRTQGFSKIMYYIANTCQIAAYHCREILRRGHLLNDFVMGYSMISRIWYCSRYYITCACQWYSQLLPYLEKLELSGPPWLPEGYTFPSDLRAWLGPDILTGELMKLSCGADVVQISEDISMCEGKDIGVPLSRSSVTRDMSEDRRTQTNNVAYMTKYDKLLVAASNTPLEVHDVDPREEYLSDLGEIIPRHRLSSLRPTTGNTTIKFAGIIDRYKEKYNLLKKDSYTPLEFHHSKPTTTLKAELSNTKYSGDNLEYYGETISREQFASVSDKRKEVSITKSTADSNLSTKYKLFKTCSETPFKSCSSVTEIAQKREKRKRKPDGYNLHDCGEDSTDDESPVLAPSAECRLLPLKKRESTWKTDQVAECKLLSKSTPVLAVEAESRQFLPTEILSPDVMLCVISETNTEDLTFDMQKAHQSNSFKSQKKITKCYKVLQVLQSKNQDIPKPYVPQRVH